jgi:hypothetical protein
MKKKIITPLLLLVSVIMMTLTGCSDDDDYGAVYITAMGHSDTPSFGGPVDISIYAMGDGQMPIYEQPSGYTMLLFTLPGSFIASVRSSEYAVPIECLFQIKKGKMTLLIYDYDSNTLTLDGEYRELK